LSSEWRVARYWSNADLARRPGKSPGKALRLPPFCRPNAGTLSSTLEEAGFAVPSDVRHSRDAAAALLARGAVSCCGD